MSMINGVVGKVAGSVNHVNSQSPAEKTVSLAVRLYEAGNVKEAIIVIAGIKDAQARDKAYLALAGKMIENNDLTQAIGMLKSLETTEVGATILIEKILPKLVDANRFDTALYGLSVIKDWSLCHEIFRDIITFVAQSGLTNDEKLNVLAKAKSWIEFQRNKFKPGSPDGEPEYLRDLRKSAADPIFR